MLGSTFPPLGTNFCFIHVSLNIEVTTLFSIKNTQIFNEQQTAWPRRRFSIIVMKTTHITVEAKFNSSVPCIPDPTVDIREAAANDIQHLPMSVADAAAET